MNPIRVIVHGAAGKVGQEVVKTVSCEDDMQLVGAVDIKAAKDSLLLPDGSSSVPFSTDLGDILARCQPDVMVDFSIAKATMPAVRLAAEKGVNLVIGTTGFSPDDVKEIEGLTAEHKIGAVMAPNFALGAILMMHLAKIAAK